MSDLIAAIATAPGRAGVGIVRLSGMGAAQTAEKVFRPVSGRLLSETADRTLLYGSVLDREGRVIDKGLAFISRAPHSYTGEDTAEIQCHGSPMVLSLVLEALFAAGARQAKAGEFTQRAFLNGRMDLTQTEAVADLLEAESSAAVRQAAQSLGGALSRRIESIYQALVDVSAHFHAVLDYPDEELDPFRTETLTEALAAQREALDRLLATCRRGALVRGGVTCAIVGRPNAGKSSLLNALLGYDRAIVTEIAGTTRDTLEGMAELSGIPFRLIDTAGLRESDDPIEKIGVTRSRAAMAEADVIAVVWDSAASVTPEDRALLQEAAQTAPTLLICSKGDLAASDNRSADILPEGVDVPVVSLSAQTGEGLAELEKALAALAPSELRQEEAAVLANRRQEDAARRAEAALLRAEEGLSLGLPPDLLLTDIEEALSALGELSGRTVREDITARIFERFCVGK